MTGISLGLFITVISVIGILACAITLLVLFFVFKKQRKQLLNSIEEGE